MRLRSIVVLTLLVLGPASLAAQLTLLDKVFSTVTDMNGHLLFGSLSGSNPLLRGQTSGPSLRGLGFEVSLELGAIALTKPDPACPKPPNDLTFTPKEVVVRPPQRDPKDPAAERIYTVTEVDTTTKIPKKCRKPSIGVGLALGYAQVSGFQGKTTLNLQTAIEELPSVAVYFTLDAIPVFAPYAGFRAGLTQLKGFRFASSDTLPPTPGGGSTYHVGLVGGLLVGPSSGAWSLFAEYAWTYRRLQNIDWKDAKIGLPSALLGPVRFDTRLLAIGLQVEIGEGKEK